MDEKSELLKRIIINPKIMLGKPTVKGTRLTVQQILGLLAQGISVNEIIEEYGKLTKEDILACLLFAQKTIDNITFCPK